MALAVVGPPLAIAGARRGRTTCDGRRGQVGPVSGRDPGREHRARQWVLVLGRLHATGRAYAYMGRQSEAEAAVEQARKLFPKLTVKWYRARIDVPEVFYEGLRNAGLPEE